MEKKSEKHPEFPSFFRIDEICGLAAKQKSHDIEDKKRAKYYRKYQDYFNQKTPRYLYKYIRPKYSFETICEEYLFFNYPGEYKNEDSSFSRFLNDPLLDYQRPLRNDLKKLKINDKKVLNKIGYAENFKKTISDLRDKLLICCLCDNCYDTDMWDVYAGRGGVCIMVDVKKIDLKPFRICYHNSNDGIIGNQLSYQIFEYNPRRKESLYYSVVAQWLLCIFTKEPSFSYEKEWRYVQDGSEDGILKRYDVPNSFIKVFFNKNCYPVDYLKIRKICKDRGFKRVHLNIPCEFKIITDSDNENL